MNELSILEAIHKSQDLTQRDISKASGISLGMVNILLKKFASVGYVKIERLTSKKVEYMLTPKGFSHLSQKTLKYISNSYRAVLKIQSKMEEIVLANYSQGDMVYILGPKDEIYEILTERLAKLNFPYVIIHKPIEEKPFIQWQDPSLGGLFLLEDKGEG